MKFQIANVVKGVYSPDKSVEARDTLTQSHQPDQRGGMLAEFLVIEDRTSHEYGCCH